MLKKSSAVFSEKINVTHRFHLRSILAIRRKDSFFV